MPSSVKRVYHVFVTLSKRTLNAIESDGYVTTTSEIICRRTTRKSKAIEIVCSYDELIDKKLCSNTLLVNRHRCKQLQRKRFYTLGALQFPM